jgi:TatD DNase family protein
MILTDTHCHLDLDRFDGDRAAVLERAWGAGLARILIPGLTLDSSRDAVKLARSHPNLYAAVGVHPNESQTWDSSTPSALRELVFAQTILPPSEKEARGQGKVVAIGEIGLDYYRNAAPPETQKKILNEQLELARSLRKPVIIHLREAGDADSGPAAEDLIGILERWVADLRRRGDPLAERPGVLHSFGGSLQTAQQAIRLGFFIGVTGPVTFKNAPKRQALVAALPLERLLIETDAPFLAPHPHRGQRNEPAHVRLIADKIGELHSRNLEQVAAVTSSNAARLFSWGALD